MPLDASLFDYELPERLIAQTPSARRDQSRLLVVHRSNRSLEHRSFADIQEYLKSGDILFRNNAAVLPGRLSARRPSGGAVECLLLRPLEPTEGSARSDREVWLCLVRPGRRLNPGAVFSHESGCFSGEVLERCDDGTVKVAFSVPSRKSVTEAAIAVGAVPLPPYISRKGTQDERSFDLERYQTVYADPNRRVAAAAPTAGLHFSGELVDRLQKSGVRYAEITLHVGLGTFRPIQAPTIEEHSIHREVYELPQTTQSLLFSPGEGRRIAVGTTSIRACEDFLQHHQAPVGHDYVGESALFIYPPKKFRGIDALITNFHQPRSTLLCLVSAFLTPGSTDGISWLKSIYREAIDREYRFFSYGDAMLIL